MPAILFTPRSGSHQDAINKGFKALGDLDSGGEVSGYDHWEVPYLPIDPKHLGRTYEDVIRVNSQSGKGGITYIMRTYHGFELPRRLQIEFSRVVQKVTDVSGEEIDPNSIYAVFEATYLATTDPLTWVGNFSSTTSQEAKTAIAVDVELNGKRQRIEGSGNGPVSAFCAALKSIGFQLEVADYQEHSVGHNSDAKAVSYVETTGPGGTLYGVGIDHDIVTSSLKALVSAVNRHAS